MKNQTVAVVTGGIVLVVGGGLWLFAPTLQSPQRKLTGRVDEGAERARRSLAEYNPAADAAAAITEDAGIATDLSRERINEMLAEDPRLAEDLIERQTERLKEIVESRRSSLRDLEARLAELDPNAEVMRQPVPGFGANVDAQVRTLSEGVTQHRQMEKANRQRLESALREINETLQESANGIQGTDVPVANRVKAAALFHQAAALERAAALQRDDVLAALRRISALARDIALTRTELNLVASSGVDQVISEQQKVVADVQKLLNELQTSATELKSEIADLNQRIEAQVARANAARAEMEALEQRGLNFDLPNPSEAFAAEYEEQAAIYRQATRQAEALRHGTLANARIEATGDLLHGAYVPADSAAEVTHVPGLDELERKLASLQARIAGQQEAVQKARTAEDELQTLRAEYVRRGETARQTLDDLSAKLSAAYDGYAAVAEELINAEDAVVRAYLASAQAFEAAKRANDQRISDMQTAAAAIRPDAKERSPYRFIEDDAWISAHAVTQASDARLWAALTLYQRYQLAQQALATLQRAEDVAQLPNFEAQPLQDRIADARERGMELAEKAIRDLESQATRLRRHWTLAASVAGADYVLAMFGRPDALEAAIANYSNVVKDRPDDPRVQIYVDRLAQLRAKQ